MSLSVGGYFLGQVPWIAKHLEVTIMLIILVSLLPAIIAFPSTSRFGRDETV